jgi:Acetyltransferase (GNAT) domain
VVSYAVKTTPELSAEEFRQLCELFTEVFHKPRPEDVLRRKYAGSGHSVHSLMLDGSRIVGAFSAIPVRYGFFGREVLFAPTADLMIAQPYRGPVRQLQMLGQGLFDGLRDSGVAFVFACLREEMKIVHQAASRWRTVGKVSYYAAPRNRVARCLLRLRPDRGAGAGKWPIEKIRDQRFVQWRYGIFPASYQTLTLSGGGAVYTTQPFYPIEGLPPQLRVGLLLDVWPLDSSTFNLAVAEICRREPRLHFLAYQGVLPFRPREMFPVPPRFEKKAWFVAGRILRNDLVDERVFDISHWNINLSNGDLV